MSEIPELLVCTGCRPAHVLPVVPVTEDGHLIHDWRAVEHPCGARRDEGWRYGRLEDVTCRGCREGVSVKAAS